MAAFEVTTEVKLNEEIKKNVRLYDKFLLVLSETRKVNGHRDSSGN